MHTYIITKINPNSVFKCSFCCGVGLGGLIGLILGLIESSTLGLGGGLFLGLLLGVGLASGTYLLSVLFNILVPYIGGIKLTVETTTAPVPIVPPDPTTI